MMFLHNTWYVAAKADEVIDKMLSRRLLNEPVVLFRTSDGQVAALADRCPHRFVPLHLGRIVEDTIQCAYHGLHFDCSGKCVVAPFEKKIPGAAKVRSYPVVERYGMIWIWMGRPEKANPDEIPDFSCMVDPERAQLHGYAYVKSGYQLVIDNLADLSHAYFVHGSFYAPQHLDRTEHQVVEEGEAVFSKFHFPNIDVPVLWNNYAGNKFSRVDRWSEIRWHAPSNLRLFAGVTPTGRPREEGINLYGVHLLTPETASTTHYFYCHCRGFRIDDPQIDEEVRNWQHVAFHDQDKPMLEAQQAAIGVVEDLMSLHPVLLSSDAGAVRIRRRLQDKIAAESASLTVSVPPLP
ncbi:vanillate monooxygenase [Trinickia symbiotica]|uniref:Vanillate monooxygenase n=1 Tax=Trinickia symbiotica TaxID=863227 RepID=A0A2T3XKR5_9BURK|nr:aromatic ring-hydroxylating dioxygenase subunit alpha [Trinickia symbiotica]PTB17082.1 vanillate monooxygenase [Trinickia symbiotica]